MKLESSEAKKTTDLAASPVFPILPKGFALTICSSAYLCIIVLVPGFSIGSGATASAFIHLFYKVPILELAIE